MACHPRCQVLVFGVFVCPTIVGQQVAREEDEVDESSQGDEDTHLGQLEHGQSIDSKAHQDSFCPSAFGRHGFILSFLQQHSVDHQVGGRADECADTANDGGVGEGNQKLGGRQFHLAGPVLDHWRKDDHHGSVVEERRDKRHDGVESQTRCRHCSILLWQHSEHDAFQ